MYFQELYLKLLNYWGSKGCTVLEPYDVEKGAGTMSPHTFFKSLRTRTLEGGICRTIKKTSRC